MSLADPFTLPGAGAAASASHKAKYRPGKAPTRPAGAAMQRNPSLISIPSPPSDYDLDLDADADEHGMDVDGGIEEPPTRNVFVPARGFDDEDEEIDQLASDSDDEVLQRPKPRSSPTKRKACALGSPANLVGGGGASRKQLLNPFLPAASSSSSSRPLAPFPGLGNGASAYPSPERPERAGHPSASPTRRRRTDPDRIHLTPPQKSRAELADERRRQEEEEERERRKRVMGWDDPENPFVERDEGEFAQRLKEKKPLKRPETITMVKRGQRISTSVPFTAVLTSTSPSDDPFTFTAPRLLFPPKPPVSPTAAAPATPPSKFLEALRAAGSEAKRPPTGPAAGAAQLPPTPATLKRKPAPGGAGAAQRGGYKRMRGLGGEGGLR
ncbi:hypothetical protein JCM10207_004152 [Rhodosporidiobolus poonsookiae]